MNWNKIQEIVLRNVFFLEKKSLNILDIIWEVFRGLNKIASFCPTNRITKKDYSIVFKVP